MRGFTLIYFNSPFLRSLVYFIDGGLDVAFMNKKSSSG
jgi:hypothetical protein